MDGPETRQSQRGQSNDALHVIDRVEVNTVIWLRSLPEAELGPSRRMTEELEALAQQGGCLFEQIVVGDRREMLDALASIADRCARGLRPVLHFDCHGTRDKGLLLAPSGESLGWSKLAEALRTVNVAARNHVCCVFGVCFGLHLSLSLRLSEPTPYFLTIAPEREVAVGFLEERFPQFYAALFEGGHIDKAYRAHLAPELTCFNCKEIMAKSLAIYIARHATGVPGRERRERIMSQSFNQRGIPMPTPHDLRVTREAIKQRLALTQAQIDAYSQTFLIGRAPGFGLAEVERLADGMKRRLEHRKRQNERREKSRRERRC